MLQTRSLTLRLLEMFVYYQCQDLIWPDLIFRLFLLYAESYCCHHKNARVHLTLICETLKIDLLLVSNRSQSKHYEAHCIQADLQIFRTCMFRQNILLLDVPQEGVCQSSVEHLYPRLIIQITSRIWIFLLWIDGLDHCEGRTYIYKGLVYWKSVRLGGALTFVLLAERKYLKENIRGESLSSGNKNT